ncbi:hypothetical protein F5Y16DRAFT_415031 [Xylariaceae sp. FL0255]|nr:hypothetical protein F5Y16DRAFT_415031 [Xylariaceae sp. FL0255]
MQSLTLDPQDDPTPLKIEPTRSAFIASHRTHRRHKFARALAQPAQQHGRCGSPPAVISKLSIAALFYRNLHESRCLFTLAIVHHRSTCGLELSLLFSPPSAILFLILFLVFYHSTSTPRSYHDHPLAYPVLDSFWFVLHQYCISDLAVTLPPAVLESSPYISLSHTIDISFLTVSPPHTS